MNAANPNDLITRKDFDKGMTALQSDLGAEIKAAIKASEDRCPEYRESGG